MDAEDLFVSITAVICEPTRAKMLWNLLDGRAHTAGELAIVAEISSTSASNHLSKLLKADVVKVETQGRHRYYSLSKPEVAYVIESLASLNVDKNKEKYKPKSPQNGIRFCRTCYDHLAGYVAIKILESLEKNKHLIKTETAYDVTTKGWRFFSEFGIVKQTFTKNRRPLTRQCLDWSERRPHLAGQLGADLLDKMREKKWFRNVQFSRELVLSAKGSKDLYDLFNVTLQ